MLVVVSTNTLRAGSFGSKRTARGTLGLLGVSVSTCVGRMCQRGVTIFRATASHKLAQVHCGKIARASVCGPVARRITTRSSVLSTRSLS